MTQNSESSILADYPVFDEKAELFGEIPTDSIDARLSGIFGLITAGNDDDTPRETALNAAALIAEAQGDAFYEVVGTAFEIGSLFRSDVDAHAALKEFFQRAARYGEARMLSRIIGTAFHALEMDGAPPPTIN